MLALRGGMARDVAEGYARLLRMPGFVCSGRAAKSDGLRGLSHCIKVFAQQLHHAIKVRLL